MASRETRFRTPDCIVRPDGSIVAWDHASAEDMALWQAEQAQAAGYRDGRKSGPDTGYGKGQRNKSRPGRSTR